MNNKRLVEIIKDPGIASEKEIKAIKSLSSDYSYSPFLKVLQARLDNLHNSKNKSKSLTRAAIYIADRAVLKDFISKDQLVTVQPETLAPKEGKATKKGSDKKGKSSTDLVKEPSEQSGKFVGVVEESNGQVVEEKKVETAETHASVIVDEKGETGEKEAKETTETTPASITESTEAVAEEERKEASVAEVEENTEASAAITTETPDSVTEKGDIGREKDTIPDDSPVKADEKPEAKAAELKERDLEKEMEEKEPETGKETSLSSEIMKNISELRKHKASLFKFLDLDSGQKHIPDKEKSKKSSKKLKSKKKHEGEIRKDESNADTKSTEMLSKPGGLSQREDVIESYPDYEEEDPEVIRNFLNKLEKSNPPPKRKLKKEEQEALIEKFIKSEPQMHNVRSSREIPEKKDLSLPSVKFRDDIISENLACIMVKQGKHEKAIDIYKKLIWKFPQKKTYFATQIEALKKKSGN